MMDTIKLFKDGMVGKVVYDEIEDSFQLEQTVLNFGLCNPLWEEFENKKVKITIEVVNE